MKTRPNRGTFSLTLTCSLLATVVSVIVLCGWLFHIDRLVALLPGLPAMAVTTAVGFLLSSLALLAQRAPSMASNSRSFQRRHIPALLVLLLGCGALVYYFLNGRASETSSETHATTYAVANAPVNRTSPNTAVNFILLGTALVLLDVPWRKRDDYRNGTQDENYGRKTTPRWPFQILALMVVLNGFLALLGQLYRVTLLYGLSHAFGMALPTAFLFFVLGVGLLAARPDRGFVAILVSDNVAGQAARRLIPVVIAIPLVLGGITLLGFGVTASFASYLLIVTSIGLLVTLFWSTILTLHQEVERTVLYARQVSDQAILLERQKSERERSDLLLLQRQFVRQMLASVTEGKLCLCDTRQDLAETLTPASKVMELKPETLRALRKQVTRLADELDFSPERSNDLITAVGEASMNAVTHGGGGAAQVFVDAERRIVQVRIEDNGKGIRDEDIHRATLEKGWSGGNSLGHGFFLMLRSVDRTYLLTGTQGTIIVLEQEAEPPMPAWLT